MKIDAKARYFRFQLLSLEPRGKVDNVVWGPVNTTIRGRIGDIIGVVRTTDWAIGLGEREGGRHDTPVPLFMEDELLGGLDEVGQRCLVLVLGTVPARLERTQPRLLDGVIRERGISEIRPGTPAHPGTASDELLELGLVQPWCCMQS